MKNQNQTPHKKDVSVIKGKISERKFRKRKYKGKFTA